MGDTFSKKVPIEQQILPSIVMIAQWDPRDEFIVSLGSGFIVDEKLQLIVTATHVVRDHKEGESLLLVGVMDLQEPSINTIDNTPSLSFKYTADVISKQDSTDACILRLTNKFPVPVPVPYERHELKLDLTLDQKPVKMDPCCQSEVLSELDILDVGIQQGAPIRCIGFDQEGDGLPYPWLIYTDENGNDIKFPCPPINQNPSYSRGMVANMSANIPENPQRLVQIDCELYCGQSGGPCINAEGKVIGTISQGFDGERTEYIVPSHYILPLLKEAQAKCGFRCTASTLLSLTDYACCR